MAHSKQVSKYVEEMLECSICLDVIKDPHTLQECFHSYCKECLDQLIQKQNNHPPGVKCPVCRNFSGKDEIRNNFFIKDLAQMYSSAAENVEKICEQCEGETGNKHPSWKCLDCRMLLCDPCKKAHQRVKLLQGHRLIPITEATEDIIDQLVFCSIHGDKPIELYCEPCKLPLCMTCKVTDHDGHTTKTTQKILEELVPEMQVNIKAVDKHIQTHAKLIKDVDTKILEVKKAFSACHEQVDKTTEERINEIKAAQKQLKDQLNQQEENDLRRLKEIKDKLDKKQKESENLKRVVLTSLDKARHATLLTELVQGGLHDKVKAIKENKQDEIPCKISLPKLDVNGQAWDKMKETGLLGKLVFDIVSILIIIGSGIKKATGRYWINTLQEYFLKPWKKILKIKVNEQCSGVALIGDKVWAPVYGKHCIEIYSKTGQLIKSININKPVSIEQSDNMDIFVASDSGLYIMTDNDTPVKVCEGSFSDICCFNDKIYALEYNQKVILEYCYDNDVPETQPEKWKQTRTIQMNNYEYPSNLDKLLVTNHGHDVGLLYFCIYVSSWNKHTIYKYNELGQQISKYGGPSEQGEAQLSYPMLCGIDSQSHILVADSNKYNILDPESGQWRDTGLTGANCTYDAKIDSDGFLWLSQHNNNNYIITKHQQ